MTFIAITSQEAVAQLTLELWGLGVPLPLTVKKKKKSVYNFAVCFPYWRFQNLGLNLPHIM